MTVVKLFKAFPIVMAAGVLGLVACGSGAASNSGSQASSNSVSSAPAQLLNFQVVGPEDATFLGPDGAKHDVMAVVGSSTVKVGTPVTITITNKDTSQHSMTASELGINIVIPAATDKGDGTISYTFTPTKAGTFRWFCAIPCDSDNAGWDMTSDGHGSGQMNFMAGLITVTG